MSAAETYRPDGRDLEIVDDAPLEVPADAIQVTGYLRQLARLRQRSARLVDLYNAERRQLDEWLEEEKGKLDRRAAHYEQVIGDWHRAVLAEEPDRTRVSLPTGTLQRRSLPQRVDVVDFEAFRNWAVDHGIHEQVLRMKVEVDKRGLRDLLADDGLVPPGVEVADGGDRIYITTTDGERDQ